MVQDAGTMNGDIRTLNRLGMNWDLVIYARDHDDIAGILLGLDKYIKKATYCFMLNEKQEGENEKKEEDEFGVAV